MATEAQIKINLDANKATKELEKLNKTGKDTNKTFQAVDKTFEEVYGDLKPLTARMGEAEDRLYELSLAGKQATKEYKELLKTVGNYRKVQIQTDMAVDAAALTMTEKLTTGLGAAAGGFAVVEGAMAAVGMESSAFEETMQKLAGVMAVLQGVNELRQSLPLLKQMATGMGLFGKATTTAAVATEGLAVAEGSAAVAATGMGVAMKTALITSGIGIAVIALGYAFNALMDAMSAQTEEEKKAEKERKQHVATMKAQKEAADEQNKTIAGESSQFALLISRLKSTNSGSKERAKLIKQINGQYGTTIQNLKDEKKFQGQVNGELDNYLRYQKAKFVLQKNEEVMNKNLEKQFELEKQIAEQEKSVKRSRAAVDNAQYDSQRANANMTLQTTLRILEETKAELEQVKKRYEKLGEGAQKAAGLMDNLGAATNDYNSATENNTSAVSKANDETQRQIDLQQQLLDLQREYEALRLEESKIIKPELNLQFQIQSDLELEREQANQESLAEYRANAIDNFNTWAAKYNKQYQILITETEKTDKVAAENLKTKLEDEKLAQAQHIKDLEKLQAIPIGGVQAPGGPTDKYLQNKKDQLDEEIKLNKDVAAVILADLEQSIADQNKSANGARVNQLIDQRNFEREILSETFKSNLDKLDAQKEFQLKSIELMQGDPDAVESIEEQKAAARKTVLEKYAEQSAKLILEQLEVEKKILDKKYGDDITALQYAENIKLEEVKKNAKNRSEFLAKQGITDVAAIAQLDKINADEQKKVFEESEAKRRSVRKLYLDEGVKLTQDANMKIMESNAEVAGAYVELTDAETDSLEKRIENVQSYADKVADVISRTTDIIAQFQQNNYDRQLNALTDFQDMELKALDSAYANKLISEEQYNSDKDKLEDIQKEQQRVLAQDAFEKNKKIQIANATINTAQAAISAFANQPGEIIAKSIAAAIATAFGLAQIATISNQPFTAARGGIVPGAGSGRYDTVDARLAPGEAVINSQSTSAFLPVLDAINRMGGGQPLVTTPTSQITQPAGYQQPNEIRAYVVERDMTDAQARSARSKRNARLFR